MKPDPNLESVRVVNGNELYVRSSPGAYWFSRTDKGGYFHKAFILGGGFSGAQPGVVIADDEAQAVESAGLEAGQELAPMDFGFAEPGADAQDGTLAGGVDAQGDEHGAGADHAVDAHFFVTGINDEIRKGSQRAVAPFFQFLIQCGGGAADLGGSDLQAAKRLQHGGDLARGDALDIHLGDGQFEGAFAAETFFEGRGIEGDLPAHLGHGEADVAQPGGDGFGFEPVGIALAQGGAFVGLSLEHLGAFQFHRVVQEDAEGFGHAFQTVVGQMLRGGVQFGIFVAVGHLSFFLFLV